MVLCKIVPTQLNVSINLESQQQSKQDNNVLVASNINILIPLTQSIHQVY